MSPSIRKNRPVQPVYQVGKRSYRIDDCSAQLTAIHEGRVNFTGYSTGWYPGHPIDTETLPGISSIGTLDTVGWKEWGLGPHRNEGIEICFLEAGSTVLHVGRTHYPLQAGDLTLTRPWQLHSLGDPTIGHCRLHWFVLDVGVRATGQAWSWPPWIILSQDNLHELFSLISTLRNPVVKNSADHQHNFHQISDALSGCAPDRFSRMAVYINAILLALLNALRSRSAEERSTERPQHPARVQAFLRRLEREPDLLTECWTLDDMAAACGLRSTAFVKYCRAASNLSPLEYLNSIRLQHAATQLLEKPTRSITDIAMACGFSSSQYFATRFRRQFNRSPSAYRRREAARADR